MSKTKTKQNKQTNKQTNKQKKTLSGICQVVYIILEYKRSMQDAVYAGQVIIIKYTTIQSLQGLLFAGKPLV